MNRRLKDRIPAAIRNAARRTPLFLLVVSATVSISPKAWARIESGDAEGQFITRTYTKAELNETAPANPHTDFDDRVAAEMSTMLNMMATNLKNDEKRQTELTKLETKQPTASDFQSLTAAGRAPQTVGPNVDRIRSFFGLEFQKVARKEVKDKAAAYAKLLNLARFDLKFGNLFKGGSSGSDAAVASNVRYGLVVKDITPNTASPRMASLADTGDELQYAGHADVQWAIEPITEEHNRHVFDGVQPDVPPPPAPDDGGFKFKLPSSNFHTGASTDSVDDLSKVSTAALPNAKLELIQDEDFYRFTYRTTMQGKKLGMEHTFKTPVAGTVELGRRFTDHFDVIETSAYNILYDKRLPMLSVHQMAIEKRYKAELGHTFEGNHTLAIAGRTDAKGVVEHPEDQGRALSINYAHDF
jgi:hypothetical protein